MASSASMVRAYVESLIEKITGVDKAISDEDGDYPIRFRGALYYIQVIEQATPLVHIFSIAVRDIPDSDLLLRRINEINTKLQFCRMFHVNDCVFIASDSLGLTLDEEELEASAVAVASASDHFAPILAKEFGGQLAFDAEKDNSYTQAPEDQPNIGMYV